jgi:5'-3' exonuclease
MTDLLADNCTNNTKQKTRIFIDGSYFCFYRYYSLLNWWKLAKPEIVLDNPFNNADFVEKFKKTFVENVENIPKKLGLQHEDVQIIVGKDCKRENIWRNELYPGYKGNRNKCVIHNNVTDVNDVNKTDDLTHVLIDNKKKEDVFYGGPFFKMAYDEELFIKGGATHIIKHHSLEADDVIAITVKRLLIKYDQCKIFIITSDKDYLQLLEPRIKIFNLAYKNIAEKISSFNDAKKDLFLKIVMGDKSDNITSVLKKCGPKTAIKCFEDDAYFQSRIISENAQEKYALNKKIIDFNEIPQHLIDEFCINYNL